MVLVRDGQTQPATTATVYVKDDMIRRDQATGLSTILDLTSDITFLVDHRNRTCATIPNKSIAARRSNFNAMLSANTNLSSTADVKPLGQTRVIAGKPAKGYKFATTIKASQKGNNANRVTIQISGEQWVSEELALTPAMQREMGYGLVRTLGSTLGAGAKPLAAKLAKIKGFPLVVCTNMTISGSLRQMNGPFKRAFVTTMTAKEVSQEPLDDKLFVVPDNYREIAPDPSQMPTMENYTLIN